MACSWLLISIILACFHLPSFPAVLDPHPTRLKCILTSSHSVLPPDCEGAAPEGLKARGTAVLDCQNRLPMGHGPLWILSDGPECLRLRGAGDIDMKDTVQPEVEGPEGIQMFRYKDFGLEPLPRGQLRTPDQDFGVDYSAHGFMFDIKAKNKAVVITGLQISSGHGCPLDYAVYTKEDTYQSAKFDIGDWSTCGKANRVFIPDWEHGTYGHLPWTSKGVTIQPNCKQGFYIHCRTTSSGVAYRVVGDVEHFVDESDPGKASFKTEEDDNIELWSGIRLLANDAFQLRPGIDQEQEEEVVRGFLGVVEYDYVFAPEPS